MTAAQGAAIARAARAAGFDFLKVYSRLSADGFRGIMDAARPLGLPVLGHIPTRVGLQAMLDAGAANIAHVEEFLYKPVWFTARADGNFTTYLSQWTDRPVVGALGGSGLRYFRVDVDYPHRRATFARP